MKARKGSGATHSFRLTPRAARIVDGIHHPRRLGGKSRKVSEAIEWFFSPISERDENGNYIREHPSHADLLENIANLQVIITEMGENTPPPPTWRGRIWVLIVHVLTNPLNLKKN